MSMIERATSAAAFRHLHALLVEYERDLPPDLRHGREPALDEVESEYNAGGAAAFLARFGEGYGGCVVVTPLDPTCAVLKRLYVQPAHRGKGAARALALAAIAFARENGCDRIVLDTEAKRLHAAFALYVSLGFVECAPYGDVDYACPTFMQLALR